MKKRVIDKNCFNNILDNFSNFVVGLIKKLNKLLNSKKKSGLLNAIVRIICCLILICVLKIPFLLIGKTVEGILYLFNLPFNELILHGWTFTYELAYVIFELIILMKTISDMSKKKEFSFEIKGSLEKGKEVYTTVYKVLRILLILSLIPIVLIGVMLLAILGMLFGFITHGVYILGPILMAVGLLIIISIVLSYMYDILFDEKGGKK